MTSFVCANCRFRFESQDGKTCPYCGGKRVGKEQSAEELLDNVKDE